MVEELGLAVAVRIGLYIFLPQQIARHVRIFELFPEVIQLGKELFMTGVRKRAVTSVKDFLKFGIIEFQKSVQ